MKKMFIKYMSIMVTNVIITLSGQQFRVIRLVISSYKHVFSLNYKT